MLDRLARLPTRVLLLIGAVLASATAGQLWLRYTWTGQQWCIFAAGALLCVYLAVSVMIIFERH